MVCATRRKKRKKTTVALGPVPQIITRIPRPYPPSAENLGALITGELFAIWEDFLSDAELYELRHSLPSLSAVEKLDALILKQAETFGWRLALSPLVHLRFSDWDSHPNGPGLFEQYGKALKKCVRVFQGKKTPPMDDPDLYRLKQETVPELRQFLHNLRDAFSRKRTMPTSDELVEHFQKIVSADDSAFLHLKTNINSWVQFFRAKSASTKPLLLRKRASPAALFDSWLAWSKGLDPETIRQKISELGKSVRHSRES